jgi:hypothetical protein
MGDKSTAKIIVNYKELAEFYEEGISTWNKIKVFAKMEILFLLTFLVLVSNVN